MQHDARPVFFPPRQNHKSVVRVDPGYRRRGIGSRLLDFAIEQARRTGRKYLCLYTSDMSTEAAAQVLYENRGLEIVARKWRLFYTVIYRELRLDPPR